MEYDPNYPYYHYGVAHQSGSIERYRGELNTVKELCEKDINGEKGEYIERETTLEHGQRNVCGGKNKYIRIICLFNDGDKGKFSTRCKQRFYPKGNDSNEFRVTGTQHIHGAQGFSSKIEETFTEKSIGLGILYDACEFDIW